MTDPQPKSWHDNLPFPKRWIAYIAVKIVVLAVVLFTALSLVTDRTARSPRRLVRSLAQLRRSPFISAPVRRKIRDYNRRDFHPDDHHDPELLDHWRNELFSSTGMLAGQLERSA